MSNTNTTDQDIQKKQSRRNLRFLAVSAGLFCAISVSSLAFYAQSPLAAARLSRLVASSLKHPFSIESLELSAQGVTIRGIRLGNPAGFPQGEMATVGAVRISPNWSDLLHGRRNFSLIVLEHPRINLLTDGSGRWNFAGLMKKSSTPRPGTGLSIGRLAITDGFLSLNGRWVTGISLNLQDLDTSGTTDANIRLAFEDAAHDRFTVEGTVRPGKTPSYYLRLSAPAIDLAAIPAMAGKQPAFPISGTGDLILTSAMKGDDLSADLQLRFHNLATAVGGRRLAISGDIAVAGRYDRKQDRLKLEKGELSIRDLTRLHASGTIEQLRSTRRFSILAGLDKIDIARVAQLLPLKKGIELAGTIEAREIRVSGTGRSITSANGNLSLRDGALASATGTMLRGVSGELSVSSAPAGFLAAIRLQQEGEDHREFLQSLSVEGSAELDHRIKPLSLRIHALSGQVRGIPFSGRAAYLPGSESPLTVDISTPEIELSRLDRIPGMRNLTLEEGKGSLDVRLNGSGIRDATGTATARVSSAKGTVGEKGFGIGDGTFSSDFAINGKDLTASGKVSLRGASYAGKKMDAGFGYRYADRTVAIGNARLKADGSTLAIGRMIARIPEKLLSADLYRYPLSMEFTDAGFQRGDASGAGISGKLQATYLQSASERWLEGNASLTSGSVSLKGKRIGAPAVSIDFSRTGGKGTIAGTVIGGTLSGNFGLNPFDIAAGATADITLTGAAIGDASQFIPQKAPVKPDSGTLDATVKGSYTPGTPPNATFTLNAADISIVGNGNKRILSGMGAKLYGSMAGSDLAVERAVIKAGEEIALAISGNLQGYASPEREGSFRATLGKTDLNLILDRFANSLPRLLQEATASGSAAVDAQLTLKRGKPGITGEIALSGVTLGAESQKLAIGSIDGFIPLSFAPATNQPQLPEHRMDFTRQNFSQLKERLVTTSAGDHALTIGSIAFGPLKIGETRIIMRSDNGLTEITSLRSSLYDGALLGTAYLSLAKGYSYGADLLLNDLSLSQLCDTFPKIKGYISGRVEGVLSLSGDSHGKEGLIGLTEFWTRETKGEKMKVSREFLQKLAGRNLSGFFFSDDRAYDKGEISASLEKGYLEFYDLAIVHTNLFGVRDLSVTVAESRNRIALEHLFSSIRNAAARGKSATTTPLAPAEKPSEKPEPGFNWEE